MLIFTLLKIISKANNFLLHNLYCVTCNCWFEELTKIKWKAVNMNSYGSLTQQLAPHAQTQHSQRILSRLLLSVLVNKYTHVISTQRNQHNHHHHHQLKYHSTTLPAKHKTGAALYTAFPQRINCGSDEVYWTLDERKVLQIQRGLMSQFCHAQS